MRDRAGILGALAAAVFVWACLALAWFEIESLWKQ